MAPIFGIYRSFEGSVDTFVQTGMGRFPNSVFIAQLLTGAIKIDLVFQNYSMFRRNMLSRTPQKRADVIENLKTPVGADQVVTKQVFTETTSVGASNKQISPLDAMLQVQFQG
jgi:hypothetical protein